MRHLGLVFLFILAGVVQAVAGPVIQAVPTRPGVTVDVLLVGSGSGPMLVMFPGGKGQGHFEVTESGPRLGNNFLVRTAPAFAAGGMSVAVLDVPSDHADGMEDAFRRGGEHLADVGKVLDHLAGMGYGPFFLAGTSRGTISLANMAAHLERADVGGYIFTSSMDRGRYFSGIPLGGVKLPVLVLHHAQDGCKESPLSAARGLPGQFTGAARVDFQVFEGGSPAVSAPCQARSAHGYYGIEDQVVRVMLDWINQRLSR